MLKGVSADHARLTIEASLGGPAYISAVVETSRHYFPVGGTVPAPDKGVNHVLSNAVRVLLRAFIVVRLSAYC